MMTMSNQALKIILGKFMELNRAGPKAPSYCISPAKLILAGEYPHYIFSDAVSFLPRRDTPPCLTYNPMTVAELSPGIWPQLPLPQETSLGWDHGFCFADGKRGFLERRPEEVLQLLIVGA